MLIFGLTPNQWANTLTQLAPLAAAAAAIIKAKQAHHTAKHALAAVTAANVTPTLPIA